MRYTIRRIDLGSIARLGLFLGWLVALLPAVLVAGVTVLTMQKVSEALQQVKPFTFEILGQQVAQLDLINMLQLQPVQQTIQPWVQTPWLTFFTLALGLILIGGFFWMFTGVMAGMVYNGMAQLGLGLCVDLVETRRLRERG